MSNAALVDDDNLDYYEVVPVPFQPGEYMAVFVDGSYGKWIPDA
jgi:hypothetical protein